MFATSTSDVRCARPCGFTALAGSIQLAIIAYALIIALLPVPRLILRRGAFTPLVSSRASHETAVGTATPNAALVPRRERLTATTAAQLSTPLTGGPQLPLGMMSSRAGLGEASPILTAEVLKPLPKRLPVSAGVQEAKLITRVEPEYPWPAIEQQIGGTVMVKATIAADGSIRNAHAITGHQTLRAAALEAIRQWRYQPTYLNQQPIEVETTILVEFKLTKPSTPYHPRASPDRPFIYAGRFAAAA